MTATCLPEKLTGPDPAREDAALAERIRAGDEAACERLVRQHSGRMLTIARRYLGEHDAADAVQDAFLSAFRAIHTFEGSSSLGTWLHRIVVNASLMKLRTKSRRRDVPLDDLLPTFADDGQHAHAVADWSDATAASVTRAETKALVRSCIDRLPESYRTVLLLRDIEERDTDETARLLGVSNGVIKTRLHRARQALRTLLEPHFRD